MTSLTYIAGGSKGLGQALLKLHIQAKHKVFEFSRSGTGPHHIKCNFNDTKAAQQCFQQALAITNHTDASELNQINLVINTATLAPFGHLAQMEPNSIKQHININIESTVALLHTFIAAYQQSHALKTITYISSGAARRDIPGLAMYSASKAFFERLISTLAEEQNSMNHPFKCMIINPGVMNTDMQAEIRQQNEKDFPMLSWWKELHETGQLADPKDIANICYELIHSTGTNGGYYVAQQLLKSKT